MKTKKSPKTSGLMLLVAVVLALFGTSCQTTVLPNGTVLVRPLPGMFCATMMGNSCYRAIPPRPKRYIPPPPQCSNNRWNGGYVRSPYGPSRYSQSGFGPFYRPGGYNCNSYGAPWQARFNPCGGGRWY